MAPYSPQASSAANAGQEYQVQEDLEFSFEAESENPEPKNQESSMTWLDRRLFKAIKRRSASLVSRLLQMGANPNSCLHFGRSSVSALQLAVIGKDDVILKMLLDGGARPSGPCFLCMSPLQMACSESQLGAIQLLLDAKVDPNEDLKPQTPLFMAIDQNCPEAVKMLLDAGADPNQMCTKSPLAHAMHQPEWRRLVLMLVAAGARTYDIVGDTCSLTLLEYAIIIRSETEVIKFFIQSGFIPQLHQLWDPTTNAIAHFSHRSLITAIIRYHQTSCCDFETMKDLLRMLEGAGYKLRDDIFFRFISIDSSKQSSEQENASAQESLQLERARVGLCSDIVERHLVNLTSFWSNGKLNTDLLNFLHKCIQACAVPQGPRRLTDLCRLSIQSSITSAGHKQHLGDLVGKLPLPTIMKKFVLTTDF